MLWLFNGGICLSLGDQRSPSPEESTPRSCSPLAESPIQLDDDHPLVREVHQRTEVRHSHGNMKGALIVGLCIACYGRRILFIYNIFN